MREGGLLHVTRPGSDFSPPPSLGINFFSFWSILKKKKPSLPIPLKIEGGTCHMSQRLAFQKAQFLRNAVAFHPAAQEAVAMQHR